MNFLTNDWKLNSGSFLNFDSVAHCVLFGADSLEDLSDWREPHALIDKHVHVLQLLDIIEGDVLAVEIGMNPVNFFSDKLLNVWFCCQVIGED